MKVALVQFDMDWCQIATNLGRAQQLMDDTTGVDLFVLPEMFATGFITEPQGYAQEAGLLRENKASLLSEDKKGPSVVDWMVRTARAKGAAVAGSVATVLHGEAQNQPQSQLQSQPQSQLQSQPQGSNTQPHYVNRLYFVQPDGQVSWYDKVHLFAPGGEDIHYTPGSDRVIVTYEGWRFLLQICYDLRFPVFSYNQDGNTYDAILYVASWPAARMYAWDTLLRARAIENKAYVLGVNRVGSDPSCTYSGHSTCLDRLGMPLCYAEETPCIRTAILN